MGQLQVAVDDAKEKFFAAANLKSAWTNPKAQLLLSVHSSNRDGSIKGPVVKLTELMDKCTEDVLVIGGDNVFGFDLNNFCSFYVARGKSCVAIQRLKQLGDVSSYGAPTLDNRGVVVSFVEKPLKTRYELVSTACYFLRKNDLERSREYLGKGGKDTLGEFTAWLAERVDLVGYLFESDWFDIGTREGLLGANTFLLDTKANREPDVVRGRTKVVPPVFVESGVVIKNSKIGPYAYVRAGSKILDSVVERSIIYENCEVRNGNIQDSIVGPGSIIEGRVSESVFGPNTHLLSLGR